MNLRNPNPLQPKFSVIIPVYNRAKMVTEAIESVLSQSFCDFELIVVDDGSVDETPKVLELYRDRAQIITQRNSGPEIARNRGAEAAKGEYLVFLDSDDMLMPWALTVYDATVSAVRHPALIVAQVVFLHQGKQLVQRNCEAEAVIYKDFLSKDRPVYKSNSTIVIRRDVFQDVEGFRYKPLPTFPCDDADFLLRVGVRGPALVIIKPSTVGYRTHEGNVVHEIERLVESVLSVIRSEKAGIYPGGRARLLDRYGFIGGMVFNWTKKAFSRGCVIPGLRLFATGFPMVVAGGLRKLLIQLRGRKPTIKIKL